MSSCEDGISAHMLLANDVHHGSCIGILCHGLNTATIERPLEYFDQDKACHFLRVRK